MILQQSFPRSAVLWILLIQVLVFLPHFNNVPIWLSVLYFACLLWRWGVYQGRWDYPASWVKIILMLAAFISVFASYQTVTGGKGGVALLLIAFAYKTLEMKERRDAYMVIMLAYFVVASAFLYQKSFFAAAYLILCTGLISAALVTLNRLPKKTVDFEGLLRGYKILLQSIPLMIFLFIFFPQLPPMFQINLGADEAKTGLSDTMSPGSISNLTQSNELAFRVKFKGQRPIQQKLYWRAQVFERFDGITWKVSDKKKSTLKHQDVFPLAVYEMQSNTVESYEEENTNDTLPYEIVAYEIYQEASDQFMLFTLATAWSMSREIHLNTDYSLSRDKKIDKLFYYQVESNLSLPRDKELSELSRTLNLTIPIYGNEKAKAHAEKLRRESATDQEFMGKVLQNYRSNKFEYTLQPPKLGANPVDEFLFDTRKGFCEHYASSFVYLMRAGGVPARIVAGYMGGEYNANGDYLLVHQFDAHAWTEVWFPDTGWYRVDPTAWVAPDRINRGIEQSLSAGERILSGNILAARRYNALTNIRLQMDYLNMQWDKWVLGYDEDMQQQVLSKLLGKVTAERIAIFMLLCFVFVVLTTALTLYLKDLMRVRDPLDRLYLKMQKKLKTKKFVRAASETPTQFAERVFENDKELGKSLSEFTRRYVRLKYEREGQREERLRQMKEMRFLLKQC